MTPARYEPKRKRKASYGPMKVRCSRASENCSKSILRDSKRVCDQEVGRMGVFVEVCQRSVRQKKREIYIQIASVLKVVI